MNEPSADNLISETPLIDSDRIVVSPTAAPTRPSRWRRLLRFSVRSILVLILLIAVPLAWWTNSARRQRLAVAALPDGPAHIYYEWGLLGSTFADSNPFVDEPSRSQNLSRALVRWLGIDYFANVDQVYLHRPLAPADFGNLNQLASIRTLVVDSETFDDEDLERLKLLGNLRVLGLSKTSITDAGLREFRGLVALHQLDLSATKITNAGLAELKGLTALQMLVLDETQTTDDGLDHLQGMFTLRLLVLDGTKVTNSGVARIQDLLPDCEISYEQ